LLLLDHGPNKQNKQTCKHAQNSEPLSECLHHVFPSDSEERMKKEAEESAGQGEEKVEEGVEAGQSHQAQEGEGKRRAEEGKETEGEDGTKVDPEGEKEAAAAEESRKEQAEEQPKEEEGDRDPGGSVRATEGESGPPLGPGPSRGMAPKHTDTTEPEDNGESKGDEKAGKNGTYSIHLLVLRINEMQ